MVNTAVAEHEHEEQHLHDGAADRDRVAPLLLVGDAEAAGAESGDDEGPSGEASPPKSRPKTAST